LVSHWSFSFDLRIAEHVRHLTPSRTGIFDFSIRWLRRVRRRDLEAARHGAIFETFPAYSVDRLSVMNREGRICKFKAEATRRSCDQSPFSGEAKVVRHGRYVIFQMAEAVPKELFQEILRLIDGLRPRPAPA
jgi:hypothetical protein